MEEVFQSEKEDRGLFYVCNLYDKGFVKSDNMRKHNINSHGDEINTYKSNDIDKHLGSGKEVLIRR